MIYFLLGWPLSGIICAFIGEYRLDKTCPTYGTMIRWATVGYILAGIILMDIICNAKFWDKRPCGGNDEHLHD